MRWGRHKHRHEQQPNDDTSADQARAVDEAQAAALQEARKGTAAEHPALVVTPDKKAHSGAFVDGVFVEARESSYTQRSPRTQEQHEREVAAGEVPGENEAMKDRWWVGRSGDPDVNGDEEGR